MNFRVIDKQAELIRDLRKALTMSMLIMVIMTVIVFSLVYRIHKLQSVDTESLQTFIAYCESDDGDLGAYWRDAINARRDGTNMYVTTSDGVEHLYELEAGDQCLSALN